MKKLFFIFSVLLITTFENNSAYGKSLSCTIDIADLPWIIAYLRVDYIEPYPVYQNSKIMYPYFKLESKYFESWEIVHPKKEDILFNTYYQRLENKFYKKGQHGKSLLPVILLSRKNAKKIFSEIPNSDIVLIIFKGLVSEEHILFFFTLWKKTYDNKLYLVKVLDKFVEVKWGTILIKEILKISDKDFLIIGLNDCGEGGEGWGNLWIGVLENFNNLKIHDISSISFFSELKTLPNGQDIEVDQKLDYKLDRENFLMEIFLKERVTQVTGKVIKDWHIIKKEQVDLKQYFPVKKANE